MNHLTYKKGFTLIELLVVISIISLLSSIVLSALNSARSKARDAHRKQDIEQIKLAMNLYYHANGLYPAVGGSTSTGLGIAWANSGDASWTALQTALSPYISSLPKDPLDTINNTEWALNGYHYSYFAYPGNGYNGCRAGQYYWLVYHLETASGPDGGITMCDGTTQQYGGTGSPTAVKTTGDHT